MAERRRRRVVGGGDEHGQDRPTPTAGGPGGTGRTDVGAVVDEAVPWPGAEVDHAAAERGLRGLIGGGSSQVTPGAAMRARDAARPSPQDLERAEAQLQIVRRNWTPPVDPQH